MKLKLLYITGFATVSLTFAFLYFPLEFVSAGIGQDIFFSPTNLAVSLASVYWENGIRYDCSNVLLLGYQSSFSQVIPVTIAGENLNLSETVGGEQIAYAGISDIVTELYQVYIDRAADLNTRVVETCGASAFSAASS